MAEPSAKNPSDQSAAGSSPARPPLRTLWPIPTLVLGLALLAGGIVTMAKRAPKPDPAAPLAAAKEAYEAREFDKAIDVVNKQLLAPLAEGALKPEDAQQVFLIRARSLWGGQRALAIDREENHKAIIADYDSAQKRGAVLGSEDLGRLAEAMIATGDSLGAVELARKIGDKEPARRVDVFKTVITQNIARSGVTGPGAELTLKLLGELLDSPGVDEADKAWAVTRQAEMRLADGHPEEAISTLQRNLVRLERLTPAQRGEIRYLLGRAYNDAGEFARAADQLAAAEAELPASHPLRAASLVLSGRIQQAAGSLEDAQKRFEQARQNNSGGEPLLAALLGLAETAAARREDAESAEFYSQLIEQMGKEREAAEREHRRPEAAWVTPDEVGASLMDRQADRKSAGDNAAALRFAQLAEMVFLDARREPPAPVLLAIAGLSRTIGEATLDEARAGNDGRLPIDQVSEVTRAEVKQRLDEAGRYFLRHAQRVSSTDETAYRQSLWNAGDCFDLAGLYDEAKQVFSQYASGASNDDPRRLESVFRRGQILAAKRQFREAMADFRQLVEGRGLPGGGSGALGDRSIVPLARCSIAEATPEGFKQAEELLTPVLTDGQSRPDSAVYRDALIELGELLHRLGRHADSISRLDEAVTRYPKHERAAILFYKLADANRQSAAQIDTELRETMPQSRREELLALRRERLLRAGECYRKTQEEVAAKDPRRLTPMDKLATRNSAFFVGDVAFELGDYPAAIAAYDTARLKFSDDPASLVGMVQIVNSYVAQKKWAEAVTANNRAEQQLRSLPDEVWKNADLPMERRHWERWLDSKRILDLQAREEASVGESK